MRLRSPRNILGSSRLYSTNERNNKTSAIAERFESILEEKIAHSSRSMLDADPKLKKISEKYSPESLKDREFKKKYQQQLAVTSNGDILKYNKHARDIADTTVTGIWQGKESTPDASLRMIVDSLPREKKIGSKKRDVRTKIAEAKEKSLDYKINPNEESDNFRELYKERLLGPSFLLNSNSPTVSLGLVSNMAEAKINSNIDRTTGRFNHESMDSVRGKPLNKQHLINSTDSNYFMNHILNKQEVLPPWIENQQTINSQVEGLRAELRKLWFKHFLEVLKPDVNREEFSLKEAKEANREILYDTSYFENERPYLDEKTKSVNSSIRNYNLQAPSPNFHKFKLQLDREIEKSFDESFSNVYDDLQKWYEDQKRKTHRRNIATGSRGTFLGLFSSDERGSTVHNGESDIPKDEDKGKWGFIRMLFRTD